VVAALAATLALAVQQAPPAPATPRAYVPVLREGDTVPAMALVDQRGRRFVFAAAPRRTTILSFVYTRCRDARVCPAVAGKFAWMQRALRPGEPIALVTVTIDPHHDTPALLARYGEAFGTDAARWTLATGDPATVERLVERFGLDVERPSAGTIAHTEAAIVLDRDGRVARIVDGAAWLPEDVLGEARAVAGEGDDPLVRARVWLLSSASALCGAGGGRFTVAAQLALFAAILAAIGTAARRAFR